MAKAAIYTANTTAAALDAGSIIPLGNTVRRFGCAVRQDGNAIALQGQGYYLITVSATLTATAAGSLSLTAQKDGVPVIGATASEAAAAAGVVNLSVTFLARNLCGCDSSLISFVLGGGTATVNNVAVTAVKL